MKQLKLADVCLKTEVVDPRSKPDWKFKYVDISSVDNVQKKFIGWHDLTGKNAPSRARNLMRCGDVILATTRPNLNAVAQVPEELDGQVCSTGFCVLRAGENLDRDFLFLFVRSSLLVKSLSDLVKGALYPAVSDKQVFAQEIPLPDLPTQRRIAARLKEQLAAVEQARQLAEAGAATSCKLLEKFLAVSFRGICPLSLGVNHSAAPDGWNWKKLPSLARLESGHTPSRRCPEYWANGNLPWLALPDIRALDCRVAEKTLELTNDLGIANSSARMLPKDTVALSRTASVGFVTIFGRPMSTSQDFVNWVCGDDLYPKFLLWLLRASRKIILEQSTGAIHKTVYMDVVERFHVCVPSLTEQQNIASKLDQIFEQIVSLRIVEADQLTALQKLPAAFLREAFGGLS